MGRRRKKVVKIVRRSLPELYLCPQCGKNTVKATVNKKREQAIVICSNCSLAATYPSDQNMMEVDAYCLFVDNFYNRSIREEPEVDK
jgi:transcription elongation factor Elf1